MPSALHFEYEPDVHRAAQVDAQVRANLSRSIVAVAGALQANGLADAAPLRALAERVASAPVRPVVFALYTGLIDAIQADDDAGAARIAARLSAPDLAEPAEFRIVNLGDEQLSAETSDLYLVMLDDEPEMPIDVTGLDPAAFAAGRDGVSAAMALLRDSAPAFAGEISALCNEVVLGASRANSLGAIPAFSSATSPYLWGGVQLDPTGAGRVALAETLVHEASHSLLNGLANAGGLSTNPREARYSSPLRHDPRPMEGIIHATYVLGRMTMALSEIATSADLTDAERDEVARRRRENIALFGQGLATIRAHGVMTAAGERALKGCFALGARLGA